MFVVVSSCNNVDWILYYYLVPYSVLFYLFIFIYLLIDLDYDNLGLCGEYDCFFNLESYRDYFFNFVYLQ
jgi:hypothetical protein